MCLNQLLEAGASAGARSSRCTADELGSEDVGSLQPCPVRSWSWSIVICCQAVECDVLAQTGLRAAEIFVWNSQGSMLVQNRVVMIRKISLFRQVEVVIGHTVQQL